MWTLRFLPGSSSRSRAFETMDRASLHQSARWTSCRRPQLVGPQTRVQSVLRSRSLVAERSDRIHPPGPPDGKVRGQHTRHHQQRRRSAITHGSAGVTPNSIDSSPRETSHAAGMPSATPAANSPSARRTIIHRSNFWLKEVVPSCEERDTLTAAVGASHRLVPWLVARFRLGSAR